MTYDAWRSDDDEKPARPDGDHEHKWVKMYDRGVVVKVVCTGCSKQQWEVE